MPLAPKGLDRADVRKLLREAELRGDVRASAIFHVLLFTGCRVGDLVQLELDDLLMSERGGTVVFRHGKGGKQRTCPLTVPVRRVLAAYMESRPPIASKCLFVGERGPMTDKGIRALCAKYAALTGAKVHPHALRHSFAHRYLEDNNNDLVGLAQLLGHESLNTTMRYTTRGIQQLSDAVDRVG